VQPFTRPQEAVSIRLGAKVIVGRNVADEPRSVVDAEHVAT